VDLLIQKDLCVALSMRLKLAICFVSLSTNSRCTRRNHLEENSMGHN
jgi:hypothetical protein